MGWNGTLEQIKEKFGGLRVYIGYGSPQVFGRIEAAELESLRTCENCGEPGKLRKELDWLKTYCDRCAEERE